MVTSLVLKSLQKIARQVLFHERNGFWTAENAFHRFSKISSVSSQISFVQHINQL